jgi:8-oxo-dGTP pyrophosphatase MutT (NUDIX family)
VKRRVSYDAAGGVVLGPDGRILVLHRVRNNEIRLPKGHVEARELLEDAAAREIREESGYADLRLITSLGMQVVEFDLPEKNQHVTRQEFYFLFRLDSLRQVERDPHEFQFEPGWLTLDEALSQLNYATEREFVRRARAWLDRGDEGLLHST